MTDDQKAAIQLMIMIRQEVSPGILKGDLHAGLVEFGNNEQGYTLYYQGEFIAHRSLGQLYSNALANTPST